MARTNVTHSGNRNPAMPLLVQAAQARRITGDVHINVADNSLDITAAAGNDNASSADFPKSTGNQNATEADNENTRAANDTTGNQIATEADNDNTRAANDGTRRFTGDVHTNEADNNTDIIAVGGNYNASSADFPRSTGNQNAIEADN